MQFRNMALNPEFCSVCLKANINQTARRKTQDPCKLLLHATSTCYLFTCPRLLKNQGCATLQTAPASSCCWGSAPHVHSHVLPDPTSRSACTTPCSHIGMYEAQPDSSPTATANIKENGNPHAQSLMFFFLRIISHIGFWLLRRVQEGWALCRLTPLGALDQGKEKPLQRLYC